MKKTFLLSAIFFLVVLSTCVASSKEFGDSCPGLSAGGYHTCVLKSNGNVDCYGLNSDGQADNYTGGDARGVSAGGYHTCILKSNGNVDCYGNNDEFQAVDYTGGDAVGVSAGIHHTCILKSNGNVDCYGDNSYGQASDYTGGDAVGVSAALSHTCVLRLNGDADCYGTNYDFYGNYGPAYNYIWMDGIGISLGYDHTCALKPGDNIGEPRCFGDNTYGQINDDYVGGTAIGLSAGGWHNCVLDVFGNVFCYGRDNYGQAADYSGGDAVGVSAGTSHTCVLKSDGNVDCYGWNYYGQAEDYTLGGVICKFTDSDGDGVSDDLDNCPNTYNPSQANADGDEKGNACDGCPNDPFKIGPGVCGCGVADYDSDSDGTPDCVDNCSNDFYKVNPGDCGCGIPDIHSDADGVADCIDNCDFDPFKTEPGLCGCGVSDDDTDGDSVPDCFDNCDLYENVDQDDWNSNGVGDACDCHDGFWGVNEDGADCGGICIPNCDEKCVPLIKYGSSNKRINVVMIPTGEYVYSDVLDISEFREDALNAIENSYYMESLIDSRKYTINFWVYKDVADFSREYNPGTGRYKCKWGAPDYWNSDCPGATQGAILHKAYCRDYTLGDVFSAETNSYGTLLHESGHGIFTLGDEYNDSSTDCGTNYHRSEDRHKSNIWKTTWGCEHYSEVPDDCHKFTDCDHKWYKSQPDGHIMDNNNIGNGWGYDAERQVDGILDRHRDNSIYHSSFMSSNGMINSLQGEEDETHDKIIVMKLNYNGSHMLVLNSTVVYGIAPSRLMNFDLLNFSIIDSSNNVVEDFVISDPRYIEYPPEPELNLTGGGELLDEVNFTIVLPFFNDTKILNITDVTTNESVALVNLSDPIMDFCSNHANDSQCMDYNKKTFSILLTSGWSLISLPFLPKNNSISSIMSGCGYNRVWQYRDYSRSWASTDTGLTEMDTYYGYWVDRLGFSDDCTITIEGVEPNSTTMDINSHWVLIGYPSLTSRSISALISPFLNYYSIWEFQDDGTWRTTDTGLVNMSAGKGYWIYGEEGSYTVTN